MIEESLSQLERLGIWGKRKNRNLRNKSGRKKRAQTAEPEKKACQGSQLTLAVIGLVRVHFSPSRSLRPPNPQGYGPTRDGVCIVKSNLRKGLGVGTYAASSRC